MTAPTLTVFCKPWKFALPQLAQHVSALGFDGVELPVRPGFPVTPDNVEVELVRAVRILSDHGLKIASIAGPTDEKTLAVCAAAQIPLVRVCVGMRTGEPYLEGERRLQTEFDRLTPLLERYSVTLGIQNHCGDRDVCNAMGLRHLIERFDPRHVAAVWDAGHNGLEGEAPESALDIVWSHLAMVNLKSAYWRRRAEHTELGAEWEVYWTTGQDGRANWPRVVAELRRRQYNGPVCLTAEYTEEAAVDRLIAEDIGFVRSLFTAPMGLRNS
ncbi:MAG: sugar phosphate isomerase [Chthonomonadaceae bacterium]|nr:sugar phosphate isomerase [Chthonomonadaceae bacterium]